MSDDRGLPSDLKNHIYKYAKKQYKKAKQQYYNQNIQLHPPFQPAHHHPHPPQPAYPAPTPYPIPNRPPSPIIPQHAAAPANPPTAPPLPPGACTPLPTTPVPTIIPRDILQLIPTRPASARVKFGANAVMETRKGLSRVLNAASQRDIHHFAHQLKSTDVSAVETDWQREDKIPVFAISYVQKNPAEGRFKFDDEQWNCFLQVVQQFPAMGISQFRIWLDQCLWLRDASQGSWAHTGLMPYVLWPVVSLGKKVVRGDRSVASQTRMWPFLEEVSGLWGMGLIFARELRSSVEKFGWRMCISYQHRALMEPEDAMIVLLFNIFHGAADLLQTGWKEDVEELNEMARMNVLRGGEGLYVGSDWRERIASLNAVIGLRRQGMKEISLPVKSSNTSGANVYLDGTRTVRCAGWNIGTAWLSGQRLDEDVEGATGLSFVSEAHQVLTDVGEFGLLRRGYFNQGLWLLVAMDGRTSNFTRGKVAWTKVMSGIDSCLLSGKVQKEQVEQLLLVEMARKVQVQQLNKLTNTIGFKPQWE